MVHDPPAGRLDLGAERIGAGVVAIGARRGALPGERARSRRAGWGRGSSLRECSRDDRQHDADAGAARREVLGGGVAAVRAGQLAHDREAEARSRARCAPGRPRTTARRPAPRPPAGSPAHRPRPTSATARRPSGASPPEPQADAGPRPRHAGPRPRGRSRRGCRRSGRRRAGPPRTWRVRRHLRLQGDPGRRARGGEAGRRVGQDGRRPQLLRPQRSPLLAQARAIAPSSSTSRSSRAVSSAIARAARAAASPRAVPSTSASANPPMTVSGVRRSWRRFASSSVSARRVRTSSPRHRVEAAGQLADLAGPLLGQRRGPAPAPSTGHGSGRRDARRRSGPVVERASTQASGPPTSSTTSATSGIVRTRSPRSPRRPDPAWRARARAGRRPPGSVSGHHGHHQLAPSSNRSVASSNVPRPPVGMAGAARPDARSRPGGRARPVASDEQQRRVRARPTCSRSESSAPRTRRGRLARRAARGASCPPRGGARTPRRGGGSRTTTKSAPPTAMSTASAVTVRVEREATGEASSACWSAQAGPRRQRRASRRDQPVSDAAHGLDRRPVVAQLLAQLRDVDVDRPGLAREVGAPDVLEQRVAGQDDAGIPGQGRQQVELAGPQLEAALADRRLATPAVDAQRADLDRAGAGCRPGRAPQDRLDPGDQGARVERLGHVVVGAQLEPDDRVDVVGPGGQHQDRRLAAPPDLAADVEARPASGSIRSRITRSGSWRRWSASASSPSRAAITAKPSFSR